MFEAGCIGWAALFGALWLAFFLRLTGFGISTTLASEDDSPADALESEQTPPLEGEDMQARRDYRDTSSHRVGPSAAVRTRPMVRRTSGGSDSGAVVTQRIRAELEQVVGALSDRLDDKFGRMDERLARMENDVAAGKLDSIALRSEIAEQRRDLGEVRDAVTLGEGKRVAAAAQGAARGVSESLGQKRWWEKWQAWAVAFVAFVAMYKNIGTLMRDATEWWRWVIGEHPPAQVRPATPPTVPEK